MEEFLATVVPMATFNARLDLGERCLDLCAEAASHHRNVDPNLIYAYANRWQEMVSGPIEESMDLVLELKRRGIQQIALSNFGHEFLPTAERFPVLQAFDQRVISFEVGLVKPNPAIFQLLLDRCGLAASDCLFVDDNAENIATASTLGFHTHQFREPADPTALRALLVRYRLLQ